MDPAAMVAGGLAVLGSRDLLNRLLGPSADYVGGEAKDLIKKCNVNLDNIFRKALKKLGKKLETPGGINPKVLKRVFDEGQFCEDEITAEYLGGVLASSRTEVSRDDRGATYINLISSMSTYQLRTHYIFYTLLRKTFLPFNSVVFPGTDRQIMCIYIPTADYYSYMDFDSDFPTDDQKTSILTHCMNGLRRQNLVGEITFGEKALFLEAPLNKFPNLLIDKEMLSDHGITFLPNPEGMELYLWGHGLGDFSHLQFLSDALRVEPLPDIELPDQAAILYKGMVEHKLEIHKKKDDSNRVSS